MPYKLGERPEEDGGLYRGFIYRKHVADAANNPAADRSWVKYFFVVKPGQLVAFKDQKHARQDRPLEQSYLAGSVVEEAKDYKKKRHCFRLRTDAGEFMFKAKDDIEMNLWIDNLKVASGELESSTMSQSTRAQTLPATMSSSSAATAEKKKGGFFTLKRK